MKQAILIMMHNKPEQVMRLVRYFPEDECVCFIHVDQKARFDFDSFKRDIEGNYSHCVVLTERYSGVLACWSLVEVTMLLLDFAKEYEKKHGIRFKYFRLLSGQDYPIRPYEMYRDLLEIEYPRNFIGVEWSAPGNHVEQKFARWRLSWPRERYANAHFFKLPSRVLVAISHVVESMLACIGVKPDKYCAKKGISTAGGASWWTISDDFAEYVIGQYKANDLITRISKGIATPEEAYFQLLYVNSSFYLREKDKKHYNLTLCNYGRRDQRVNGHTHPWRLEDYDELIQSDCYFARKFDTEVDRKILEALDNYIYEKD